jgi:hypothetical protein
MTSTMSATSITLGLTFGAILLAGTAASWFEIWFAGADWE